MAKQTGLFKFTGKLDNVIGYRRNGIHFVRSMPDKVTQTPATRRASHQFGVASRKGKLIRRAITPYLTRYDGTLVNRLNKALIQSGSHQLQALKGFRFNRYTGVDKFFALPAVYTNGLLKIPAQELPAFGRATHLEVSVIAAVINFAERRILEVEAATAIIDLSRKFTGMDLAVPVSGKGTLIVTLQVQACTAYNGKLLPIRDRRYVAADVMSVVPPAATRFISPSSRGAGKGKRSNFPPYETSLPRHYKDRRSSGQSLRYHEAPLPGDCNTPSLRHRGEPRRQCAQGDETISYVAGHQRE